jgi:hypothetical protein
VRERVFVSADDATREIFKAPLGELFSRVGIVIFL